MVKYYCTNYLDVLKIVSNFPITENYILSENSVIEQNGQVDLFIFIHKNSFFKSYINKMNKIKLGKEYLAFPDEKALCFKKNYLGVNFYICAKNIDGNPTELLISSSFRYARIPLRDLPCMGHIISSFVLLKLLSKNFTISHMALLDSRYGGIAISAYPDVGKTTTTVLLSQKEEFKALADDLAILDSNGNCYGDSFSHINIWAAAEYALAKEYFKTSFVKVRSKIGEVCRLLGYIFPPLSAIAFKLLNVDLAKIPGHNFNIGRGWTRVKYLFILEEGSKKEIIPLDREEAKRKLLNINRKEHFMFYFDNNPLFLAYSYLYKDFDFFSYLHKRDVILSNFVEYTEPFLLRAKRPYEFANLILESLNTGITLK